MFKINFSDSSIRCLNKVDYSTFLFNLFKLPFQFIDIVFIKLRFLSLILLSVLLTSSVFSRPASPCSCFSFTTIGSDNTTTNITSTSLSPNTCYLVRGTLNINSSGSGTIWDEMRIKMAEKAEIFVSTTLRITDSYITGCDAMWKGIRTKEYVSSPIAVLSISENTIIESAEFGVF